MPILKKGGGILKKKGGIAASKDCCCGSVCCLPHGKCVNKPTKARCEEAGGIWQGPPELPRKKCAPHDCKCQPCDKSAGCKSHHLNYNHGSEDLNPHLIRRFHIGNFTNPFNSYAHFSFNGYVNDDLVINGKVIHPHAWSFEGPGSPNGAHDLLYCKVVKKGETVRVALDNNYNPGYSMVGVICWCPFVSPPP